jgi:Tfp pilus assembly protein PilO
VTEKFINFFQKISWQMTAGIDVLALAFHSLTYDTSTFEQHEESIRGTLETISQMEGKLDEAKRFEKEYDAKKAAYKQLVNELIAVQGALPKQFILPDIIDDLLREARQLEIDLVTITPDAKEDPKEFYSSLGFTIDARGTYLQFLIFMERITSMKRLLSVPTVNFSREGQDFMKYGGRQGVFLRTNLDGGTSIYPALKGTFKILTYRYRPEAAQAPAATPPVPGRGGANAGK